MLRGPEVLSSQKIMKYISSPQKGTLLQYLYVQVFTQHPSCKCVFERKNWKIAWALVSVYVPYTEIFQIYKTNCAHKWIYFEISLISKICYLRCFVLALLKLLSYLSFSFMETKEVCVFTFPSCSCCNVVLNWIYWSSWTILVLCDLQVVFNFSLRNIQIIYFLTPSPLIFATRALRVDFSFINILIYYFCIDKIL